MNGRRYSSPPISAAVAADADQKENIFIEHTYTIKIDRFSDRSSQWARAWTRKLGEAQCAVAALFSLDTTARPT